MGKEKAITSLADIQDIEEQFNDKKLKHINQHAYQ